MEIMNRKYDNNFILIEIPSRELVVITCGSTLGGFFIKII